MPLWQLGKLGVEFVAGWIDQGVEFLETEAVWSAHLKRLPWMLIEG